MTPTLTPSPSPTLPGNGNDAYTVLLIHSNHTDGATGFQDASLGASEPHPITPYGDAQHDTDYAKFSQSSICFDGTGDYLRIPDSIDWDFGSGDFTVDFWIRTTASQPDNKIIGQWRWEEQERSWQFRIYHGTIEFSLDDDGGLPYFALTSSGSLNDGEWHHVAGAKSATDVYLFIDGHEDDNGTFSGVINNNSDDLFIGSNVYESQFLDGHLDEIRITKGLARWTTDFTPPDGPYGDVQPTPTVVLTPTMTPSPTSTHTLTPSNTPTRTLTLTPTRTPTLTPTRTPSSSPTYTPSPSPSPQPNLVWVDDDWAGSEPGDIVDGHVFGYDAFAGVQEALEAVAYGGEIRVNSGIYDETVTFESDFNKDNLLISGEAAGLPVISGGILFQNAGNLSGLYLEYLHIEGDAGSDCIISMTNTGAVRDFVMDECVLDGHNAADRHGIYGNKLGDSFAVTNTEFRNILGSAVMDMDPVNPGFTGENELPVATILFAGNYIHDCNGVVALRGDYSDLTDLVECYDNVWSDIGGNQGQTGQHYAALEINHAGAVELHHNSVNNVSSGEGGEGQAFRLWDISELICVCNDVTGNAQGIFLFGGSGEYGGPYPIPDGYAEYNNIQNNVLYGLTADSNASGGTFQADFNYWGASDGPSGLGTGSGDEVWGDVLYDPWLSSSQGVPCPPDCRNDGDVDNNGELTPGDGLHAFNIYLQDMPEPTFEEFCSADCDGNAAVTPGDAQCILWNYVMLDCECVDAIGPFKNIDLGRYDDQPHFSHNRGKLFINDIRGCAGDLIDVPVMIRSNEHTVHAAGFDLFYDPQMLKFISCRKGELNSTWNWFICNRTSPGHLRTGAFDPYAAITPELNGSFAVITFEVVCVDCFYGDESAVIISNPVDQIRYFRPEDGIFTYDCSYAAPSVIAKPTTTPVFSPAMNKERF